MDPNKLITPDEAAEILGITGNRVRQKTRKGRLPAQKVTDCWLVIHTGELALMKDCKGGWPNGVQRRRSISWYPCRTLPAGSTLLKIDDHARLRHTLSSCCPRASRSRVKTCRVRFTVANALGSAGGGGSSDFA